MSGEAQGVRHYLLHFPVLDDNDLSGWADQTTQIYAWAVVVMVVAGCRQKQPKAKLATGCAQLWKWLCLGLGLWVG